MTVQSFDITVTASVDEIEPKVRAALGEQGFGVVSEIDVSANLRAALGVERPALKILGACNPTFALQALELDPTVALLLPCNVVLEATDAGTHVGIIDPLALIDDPAFAELVEEAAERLRAVIVQLSERDSPLRGGDDRVVHH